MSLIVALVLGVIQGLTEFIPISSTAHLTVAASLFGVIDPAHPERWTAFMATIQLGTLAAVMGYFRSDIIGSATSWFSENVGRNRRPIRTQSADARLGWFVIVGTIPIVIVGLTLKDVLEGNLTKELWLIGTSMMVVAIALWVAERTGRFTRTTGDLTFTDAIVVGFSQCLALIPGSSRSGSTMMAALFRGLTREHAARFSFLLSIPAILAAGVLEFVGELDHIIDAGSVLTLLVATVAALISGYWSIAFLLRYLRTHTLGVFIAYRLLVGAVLILTSCSPQEKINTADPVPMEANGNSDSAPVPTTDVVIDPVATDTVVLNTSKGAITIELYGTEAPLTVRNFLDLVREKFYDDLLVHRVATDFIIQLGDPLTAQQSKKAEWGRGGRTANGKPLAEELNAALPAARRGYVPGAVAMARKPTAGTGTSQFFICLEKANVLPYQYTIFGYVIDGMDVARAIGRVEVEPGPFGDSDGVPRNPISINSIRRRTSEN